MEGGWLVFSPPPAFQKMFHICVEMQPPFSFLSETLLMWAFVPLRGQRPHCSFLVDLQSSDIVRGQSAGKWHHLPEMLHCKELGDVPER